MSTRARIGILNDNGTVTSIYTHLDGYPEHHWPIIKKLGEKHDFNRAPDGVCNAYGRGAMSRGSTGGGAS